jgi:tetrahydrodipicolinate N-succinyltransferase
MVMNIGEKCWIGARSSTARNAAFPDQIREGITVIGMNAELPAGLRVEAGAYIASGVSPETLKKQKIVRRGASIRED